MDTDFVRLGITCIGTLLGVWLGYRLSLSHTDRIERHTAGLKLRDAFRDEILALNPAHCVIDDLPAFLWAAFPKHEVAIYDFSFSLKSKRKIALYKVWQEYYCYQDAQNENTVPFLEQYSCRSHSIKEVHGIKNLVKSRLEAILEFTLKT